VLDRKLGGQDFPGKKMFGSKNPEFVEKRRVQLQEYLNKVGKSKSSEFLKFVKQIKDSQFNKDLK
jgi:hypothetical protein